MVACPSGSGYIASSANPSCPEASDNPESFLNLFLEAIRGKVQHALLPPEGQARGLSERLLAFQFCRGSDLLPVRAVSLLQEHDRSFGLFIRSLN